MTFKKILVPMDGSDTSERVLDLITGLATRCDAELLIIAITGSHTHFEDGDDSHAHIGDEKAGAEHYLAGHAERLGGLGLKVSSVVEPGIPADVILDVARRNDADLIAMATHRESALVRGILGSVTDTVLRTSPVPVLAVHPNGSNISPGPTWLPSTIIVPLDGSDLAAESVKPALELAAKCEASVEFMQAVHLPAFAVSGPGAEYYGSDYGVSAQRAGAREYLAQFVEQAKSMGLTASSHAALGNAAARIVEDSKKLPDALIVISSHGRSGFRRMILGSVADKVIRASHHTVLVLKHVHRDE